MGVLVRALPGGVPGLPGGRRARTARRSPSSASTRTTRTRPRRSSSDTRPLPFPSYTDPKDQIARKRAIAVGFPMTQFIGRDGKTAYIHTGPYTSEAQLTEDIERYLN